MANPCINVMSFPFTQSYMWFLTPTALCYKDRKCSCTKVESLNYYIWSLAVLSFTTQEQKEQCDDFSTEGNSQKYWATYNQCVYQPAPKIADRNLNCQRKGSGRRWERRETAEVVETISLVWAQRDQCNSQYSIWPTQLGCIGERDTMPPFITYHNSISLSAPGAELMTCCYIQDKNSQRGTMLLVRGRRTLFLH